MSAKVIQLSQNFTLNDVKNMSAEERESLAKQFAKVQVKFDDSKEELNDGTKRVGILLCGFAIALQAAKEAKLERQDCDLKEYANRALSRGEKGKLTFPARAYTFKRVVGAFVENGHITEEEYYRCSVNALDLSGRILTAVEDKLDHEVMPRVIEALKKFSDKSAKTLRAILETVQPSKPITAEKAIEMLAGIISAGHRDLIAGELADSINDDKNALTKNVSYQSLYAAMQRVEQAMTAAEETAMKAEIEDRERLSSTAPVQFVAGATETDEEVALEAATA